MWASGEWVFDTAAVRGGGRIHRRVHTNYEVTTRIVRLGGHRRRYHTII